MTISPYIRGNGPGHNPTTEPPTESDCQGNGWVVCTTVTTPEGAILKRRLNPDDWAIMRSLGYVEEIVPQSALDLLDWELGRTVVSDTPPRTAKAGLLLGLMGP
jgi:hypothetical protein